MVGLSWNDLEATTRSTFQYFWENNNFTDVTLVTKDNEEIKAHKVILSNGSQLLKDMLLEKPDENIFNVDYVTYNELKPIIKFIYLGECEVVRSEWKSFLSVGRKLEVIGLQKYDSNKFEFHDGMKYECKHCKYEATNEMILTNHIQLEHVKTRPCCDQCEFEAENDSCLRRHIHTVHESRNLQKNASKKKRKRSDVIPVYSSYDDIVNTIKLMSRSDLLSELQKYILGETETERTKNNKDDRKRSRDRIVKRRGESNNITEWEIEVEMLVKIKAKENGISFKNPKKMRITPNILNCPLTTAAPPLTESISAPPVPENVPAPLIPDIISTSPGPPVPDSITAPLVPDSTPTPHVTFSITVLPVQDSMPTPPVPYSSTDSTVPDSMPTTPVPYSITVPPVPDSTPAPNTDTITYTASPSTDGPSSASSWDSIDLGELIDNTLCIPNIIDVNQYIHEGMDVTQYTWEVMDNEIEQLPSNIQDQNHHSNFSLDALVNDAANTHLSK